jgi:hypothetical protein
MNRNGKPKEWTQVQRRIASIVTSRCQHVERIEGSVVVRNASGFSSAFGGPRMSHNGFGRCRRPAWT